MLSVSVRFTLSSLKVWLFINEPFVGFEISNVLGNVIVKFFNVTVASDRFSVFFSWSISIFSCAVVPLNLMLEMCVTSTGQLPFATTKEVWWSSSRNSLSIMLTSPLFGTFIGAFSEIFMDTFPVKDWVISGLSIMFFFSNISGWFSSIFMGSIVNFSNEMLKSVDVFIALIDTGSNVGISAFTFSFLWIPYWSSSVVKSSISSGFNKSLRSFVSVSPKGNPNSPPIPTIVEMSLVRSYFWSIQEYPKIRKLGHRDNIIILPIVNFFAFMRNLIFDNWWF